MRRIVALCLGALSAVTLTLNERRAVQCHDGLFVERSSLPAFVEWHRHNATSILMDEDGWGIVWPPGRVYLSDGSELIAHKIRSFLVRGQTVFVDLELESSRRVMLRIEPIESSLEQAWSLTRASDVTVTSEWTVLDPTCPMGAFDRRRALAALPLAVAVALAATRQRQARAT